MSECPALGFSLQIIGDVGVQFGLVRLFASRAQAKREADVLRKALGQAARLKWSFVEGAEQACFNTPRLLCAVIRQVENRSALRGFVIQREGSAAP